MPEDRLNMRLDDRTIARLKLLEQRTELKRPDLIKQAIKRWVEQEGLEQHGTDR